MQTDDDRLRQAERVSMQDKRIEEYMEMHGLSRRLARRAIQRRENKEMLKRVNGVTTHDR